MNSDSLAQVIQKGFRVTLGATATLVEMLQDPEKRHENWSKLSSEWSQLADEWAAKGTTTEAEARTFMDTMVSQLNQQGADSINTGTPPRTINTTATTVVDPSIQTDLHDLTDQIAAMRAEIDRLKDAGQS